MLKFVSAAAAAALLLTFTPAFAGNPPQDGKDQVEVPGPAQTEEQAKATQSPEQAADDDVLAVIMGNSMRIMAPNPYKNPSPRMITDAWAMRA